MSTSFSEHYSLLTSQLPPTDPKKSNKISDVVKLKRMLKKWRKQANSSPTTITASSAPTTPTHHSTKSKHMGRTTTSKNIQTSTNNNLMSTRSTPSSIKGIKFLKRTLSFPDRLSTTTAGSSSQTVISSSSSNVSKGYLAVDVGEEMKRFTIPMSYLGHEDFVILLKEAEEEFGFQQEGVLRIPCEVEIFEMILKGLEQQTKNNTSRRRNGNHQSVHGCGTIDQSQILTTKTTPYHRHQYHPASPIYHPASPMCR